MYFSIVPTELFNPIWNDAQKFVYIFLQSIHLEFAC